MTVRPGALVIVTSEPASMAPLFRDGFLAFSLFGDPAPYPPQPDPVDEVPEAPGDAACPGQLTLPVSRDAPHQPSIWDAEPEPRQLALLPDPEPWEAERPRPPTRAPGPSGRRLARRRARAAPSPDQLPLF